MTICGRLADIHAEISETPTMNGCFSQEQTVAKISGMTEMRTFLPVADAAKSASARRPNFVADRRTTVRFPGSGRLK